MQQMKLSLSRTALSMLFLLACDSPTDSESPPEGPPSLESPATDATPSDPMTAGQTKKTPRDRPAKPKPTITPGTPAELRAAANASNAFGFDLYAKIRSEPGNLVISPASLSAALTMTYGGARGTTASQMKQVLHLDGEPDAARDSGGKLLLDLSSTDPVRLSIANRLFGEKSWKFEDTFLGRTRAAYGAPLEQVDFIHHFEESRVNINQWVAGETEDLVRDLVPPGGIDETTRLALVNAIYFLGDWAEPFEKEATGPRAFRRSAKESREVPTMAATMNLPIAEVDGAVAVELPYAGDRFAMTLVMPKEVDGLEALEAKLGSKWLDGVVGSLKSNRVDLRLPKFEVEPPAALELSKKLQQLGMVDAFDGLKADFGGMSSSSLAISQVFHKGFIRVDEKGTEAAAATAVIMKNESADVPGREVAFDHPFLFVLRDKKTGLALFVGRVTDPG
jgi:serpin B